MTVRINNSRIIESKTVYYSCGTKTTLDCYIGVSGYQNIIPSWELASGDTLEGVTYKNHEVTTGNTKVEYNYTKDGTASNVLVCGCSCVTCPFPCYNQVTVTLRGM